MPREERAIPYLFLTPAVLLLILFRVLPALTGLRESFFSSPLSLGGRQSFIGLGNIAQLFVDPSFWRSMLVTLLFNLVVNPLQIVLALGLSLLANSKVKGVVAFRSIYLVPVAISFTVTSLVWGVMLDKNSGLINGVLGLFRIPQQPFLVSAAHALWSIAGVVTWKAVPYWMIFFLAGLQGIPKELLDAAAIDGTTSLQVFYYVTLPLLRRIVLFVLVADTIGNFILFEPIFLLTRGGPQLSTNLVMYDAYRRGFIYGDVSLSAAMTLILLLVTSVIVTVEFGFLRSEKKELI